MTDLPHLTRRQTLGALGAAAGGVLLADTPVLPGPAEPALALAACSVLAPEEEEGPYYVDLEQVRHDLRRGKYGVPLELRLRVMNTHTCQAIEGAAVDVWHCDALGRYSDESSEGTSGRRWLRGVQLSDADGLVSFRTVYPGHYEGRATHVHVKVHVGGHRSGTRYTGGHVCHTGQLFFPDALSRKVYRLAPYSSDTSALTLHGADRVYTGQHGARSTLHVRRLGSGLKRHGVRAALTLGVHPHATPAAA